jgi:hypothetical protein
MGKDFLDLQLKQTQFYLYLNVLKTTANAFNYIYKNTIRNCQNNWQ